MKQYPIIVTHNGVTMIKPHWMSIEYWNEYEAPRCGKFYGNSEVLYGAEVSSSTMTKLKQQAQQTEASSSGECDGCTI